MEVCKEHWQSLGDVRYASAGASAAEMLDVVQLHMGSHLDLDFVHHAPAVPRADRTKRC